MDPEFDDARPWENVNCEAGVRREDCRVVAQYCQLRVAHPRHLLLSDEGNSVISNSSMSEENVSKC